MDNFKNFASFTVSQGYNAGATSIDLSLDPGAACPTLPANAVWWNSEVNPQDDPNVEIVRVTARTGATLTITRGQEGTSASTKNAIGKTYKIAFVITAKTLNTDLPALLAGVPTGTGFRHVTSGTEDGATVPDAGTGSVLRASTVETIAAESNVASAGTTDIGASTRNVNITGTTTITSFGTVAAGTMRYGRFAGILTLTHNATSLILPNAGSNITTAAGDRFMALSLGSGNWLVYFYQRADGTALVAGGGGYAPGGTDVAIADGGTGASTAAAALDNLITAEASVASASTTDLGAQSSQNLQITGTTTITSFGTAAAGVRRWCRFAGVLTLTHNGTSLILPGNANITTAAGDRFMALSLGSGNWLVYVFTKADGSVLLGDGSGGTIILPAAGDGMWFGTNASGTETVSHKSAIQTFDYVHTVAEASLASASTTDLGAQTSPAIQVTGTTTITSFGTVAAGVRRFVRFAGALTLTHNATSLILPGGANITTAANDRLIARSLGSGNWLVEVYQKADGTAVVGGGGGGDASTNTSSSVDSEVALFSGTGGKTLKRATGTGIPKLTSGVQSIATQGTDYLAPVTEATIASAATTDLGTNASDNVQVTGTTTITSFGSSAPTGKKYYGRFAGALTLTHNGTSLILPGAANITTAANDRFIAEHLGSGNWIVLNYSKADGTAVAGGGGGSSPTTTRGDMIYRNATVDARLAIKRAGSRLMSDGVDPGWRAPLDDYRWHEDFRPYRSSASNPLPVDWCSNAIATPTGGGISVVSPTWPEMGAIRIDSGTAVDAGNEIRAGDSGSPSWVTLPPLQANANWIMLMRFRLNSTTQAAVRIGVRTASSSAAVENSDWMGFRFDTAGGINDTGFMLVTRAGGAYGLQQSAIAADTNYHTLMIRSTTAGTVLMSLDYGTEYSTSSNVPVGAMLPFFGVATRVAATAKTIDADAFFFYAWGLNR
jgi:hypothetical protein